MSFNSCTGRSSVLVWFTRLLEKPFFKCFEYLCQKLQSSKSSHVKEQKGLAWKASCNFTEASEVSVWSVTAC